MLNRWTITLFVMLALGTGGYYLWHWWWVELPVDRMITDTNGRTLQGTIEGRSSAEIRFQRVADQSQFDIRVTDLSKSDQRFLLRIRPRPLPEPINKRAADPRISIRQKEIARLNNVKLRLDQEIIKASNESDQNEGLINDLKKKRAEAESNVKVLQAEIEIIRIEKRPP